jgi:hypothetical protein
MYFFIPKAGLSAVFCNERFAGNQYLNTKPNGYIIRVIVFPPRDKTHRSVEDIAHVCLTPH